MTRIIVPLKIQLFVSIFISLALSNKKFAVVINFSHDQSLQTAMGAVLSCQTGHRALQKRNQARKTTGKSSLQSPHQGLSGTPSRIFQLDKKDKTRR